MRSRFVMNQNNDFSKRRRYRSRLKPFCGWPDMTAALDVFFLVLLFFALSCSFIRIPGIGVDLPRMEAPEVADLDAHVVSITPPPQPGKECQFYFKDKIVSMVELEQEFFKIRISSHTKVVICADKKVPFDTVSQVMAKAEAAKLPSFIVVMPPEVRKESDIEK